MAEWLRQWTLRREMVGNLSFAMRLISFRYLKFLSKILVRYVLWLTQPQMRN